MITKGYRLALAKMLKLYKEISTKEAVLVAEAEEIEVGTEVFVESEEGMVPAQDGEYIDEVNKLKYVVEGGSIKEISEIVEDNSIEEENTQTEETMAEENNEGSENGESNDNESAETGSTTEVENNDEMEALKAENEALKAKVAQLEATVSDLEDQIAAYKEKEEETAPSVEEAEKFSVQKTGDKALDKKLAAAKKILYALK